MLELWGFWQNGDGEEECDYSGEKNIFLVTLKHTIYVTVYSLRL